MIDIVLYAKNYFFVIENHKKTLFANMGKAQKSSKQRYFRYIRSVAQEAQQQQQQLQQQPLPQNDLLIRSLNVAAELFTAGAESVTLQGEAEEQLQE